MKRKAGIITSIKMLKFTVFLLFPAILHLSSTVCQELPISYNATSTTATTAGACSPETHQLRESTKEDLHVLINSGILPLLLEQTRQQMQSLLDMEHVAVVIQDGRTG